MNLNKHSTDPRRRITWRGKSLSVCSKAELIDCIINLSAQLVEVKNKKPTPVPSTPDGSILTEIKHAG